MKVYQLYKESNHLIREYDDVIRWGVDFVEYHNGGRCKIYCNSNEYFTDKENGFSKLSEENE